mgnify:CR=1 FL=1
MSTKDKIERHLANWADWHRKSSDIRLGYPSRAMVATGGGQSVEGVFEEMCEQCDRHAAEVMEALINGLADNQRIAIHYHWLGCKLRLQDHVDILAAAYTILTEKMRRRGLL